MNVGCQSCSKNICMFCVNDKMSVSYRQHTCVWANKNEYYPKTLTLYVLYVILIKRRYT